MLSSSITIICKYTFLEASKNKLLWLAGFTILSILGLATFTADTALTEVSEVELSLLLAGNRFAAAFITCFFVISTMVREFNDKVADFLLALPISRTQYLLSKLFGFGIFSVAMAIIYTLPALLYTQDISLFWWSLSLMLELWILCCFSMLCVISFNSQLTLSLIVTIVFYLFCRSANAITLVVNSEIIIGTATNLIVRDIFKHVYYVLPNLSNFTQTSWLINDTDINFLNLLIQAVIITSLLICAMLVDFRRKNL